MNPADTQNSNPESQNTLNEQSQQQQPPSVPQLENETPLDITIYPSNENAESNLEPEKIINEPTITLNLNPIETIQTTKIDLPVEPKQELPPLPLAGPTEPQIDTQTNSNPLQPQENNLNTFNNQKIAIIGGVLFGILVVAGISVYYLSTLTNSTQNQSVITNTTLTPAGMPQTQTLTTSEYKLKIDSSMGKLNSVVTNNPINFELNNFNNSSLEFVGNEIFAIATEVNEINTSDLTKSLNDKLHLNLINLVNHLDLVLKTYKTSTAVSPMQRQQFQAEYLRLISEVSATTLEIKNLQ